MGSVTRLILPWAYFKGGAFVVVLWGSVTRLLLPWAYYKGGAFVVVLRGSVTRLLLLLPWAYYNGGAFVVLPLTGLITFPLPGGERYFGLELRLA